MKTLSSPVLPGYGIAAASAALATLAQLPLRRLYATEHPFPCFYVAILATAWYAGLRWAILVLALSTLSTAYFFLFPLYSFRITDPADQVGLGLYFASGLTAILLLESQRRQRRQAADLARSQAMILTREQAARAEAEAANRRLAEEQRAALALAEELAAAREKLAKDNEELQRQRDALRQRAPEPQHEPGRTPAPAGSQPAEGQRDRLPASVQPLERLPIRDTYSVLLLRVAEIDFAESRNRRIFVRANGVEHLANYSLTRLEKMLPSDAFIRIHDSCIVNLDRIVDLLLLGSHSYEVRLTDGHRLPVGRTRYPELRRRLGLDDQIGS